MTNISKPKEVHFLACVHGMWGSPVHLLSAEKTILEKFSKVEDGAELATLRVQTNAESFTYDGLDWGAERAVREIYEKIEEIETGGLKKVTRFSIVGYSLGGLISRYAIGILYQRGFFKTVKPVNFTTFATPHLGLPQFRGFVGRAMHRLGPVMLSRTGRQFYGTDNDTWSPDAKEGRPLVEVMSEKDTIFFKALSTFPHMTIYGNAVNDMTVTYCTALIEPHDPFTKSHRVAIEMEPEYKHVIKNFYKVPKGEKVPLHDLAKELQEEQLSHPWYSPARYRKGRSNLPPFLQFPFPLNILFYMCIPILIPLALTYAAIRFRRESNSSRKRLEELDASPDASSSLGAMMRRMELAITDAVNPDDPQPLVRRRSSENAMEQGATDEEFRKRKTSRADTPEADTETWGGTGSLPTPPVDPAAARSGAELPSILPQSKLRGSPDPSDKDQPILTASHLKMIESLNSIPQMKKFRAYFPYARNAHSVIIARDPDQFPMHKDGLTVLRHWADRFVL